MQLRTGGGVCVCRQIRVQRGRNIPAYRVSAMVFVVGGIKSFGLGKLPETNKKVSYSTAGELMKKFQDKIGTLLCSEIKSRKLHSCDGCIAEAVRILEEFIGEE